MNSCLTQEQLTGYTRNSLEAEEKTRVENHLLQCSLCFDAAEGIAELDSREDAVYHLNSIRDDIKIKSNTGAGRYNLRIYISAAAVVLIACTAALLLFRTGSSASLFEEFYKPYPNIVPMVRGDETDFDLKAAMVLYNSGNYEQAVAEFDKILSTGAENETALFYKGVSYLSLGKGDKAASTLKTVLGLREGSLKNQAEWYLALSYILNNDKSNAENLLAKIISENNYYSSTASKLKSRLNGGQD